jgi:hypothetical protein
VFTRKIDCCFDSLAYTIADPGPASKLAEESIRKPLIISRLDACRVSGRVQHEV